jgi:hypothetical protein
MGIDPSTRRPGPRPQIGGDLGPEARHRRVPARRVEIAEMMIDDCEDLGCHPPHVGIGAPFLHCQVSYGAKEAYPVNSGDLHNGPDKRLGRR